MSAPVETSPRSTWKPTWFLAGFALALILLAWSGRQARYESLHPDFVRFHPMISPESLYQITLEEMVGIVRSRTRPDQILILIGGNSILNGVSQPPGKVWSERLQQELGEGYSVVNFAFRGGMISDGAGVVSEILRDEFPRQILVANTSPLTPTEPTGSGPYRYLVRAAWDRGLLVPFPSREAHFRAEWPRPLLTPEYYLNHLDGWIGYRSFWNRVALRQVSTVRFASVPDLPDWLRPRLSYGDQEIDGDAVPVEKRYRPAEDSVEMEIVRGTSSLTMGKDAQGRWTPIPAFRDRFLRYAEMSRPPELRPKTLVLIGQNSPYYLRRLEADELARDQAALEEGLKLWEVAGYASLAYRDGFTEADYWDRTHLTPSGGVKLAAVVAPKLRAMSKELGYE